MSLPIDALSRAANEARGLAMDAVHTCQSGHLGLPLGCAEIGAVLWGSALNYNPEEPRWLNRDRFVLSAGHGSMFIYSWLHLSGYPQMTIDEVKRFRALGSCTPGHPESFETKGVEATTGPLGQGVGNSVGIAVSQKMAAARYNTGEHKIFDNHVIALAGDGCLQEGVAMEAVSYAGHNRLDNLILFYDSNGVTLDAMADKTQSEDDEKKFSAMGWNVQVIDGNDLNAIAHAFEAAKAATGKPQLIICKTLIGKGIPEVAGTAKAHGEGGAKFVDAARKGLGLPEEHFFVSKETHAFFAERKAGLIAKHAEWTKTFDAWTKANPKLAEELATAQTMKPPADLLSKIPEFPADAKIATRKAGGDVLQPIAQAMPTFISGSADLYGSTLNYIKDGGDFEVSTQGGRNMRFGIREHAMCAMLNGFAYDKIFRPSGATFLVFADYCRPSIRLAALSHLPVVYIFTHDSVGVGEDGPTHQPVETVSGLRLIPNLHVIRPADPEETAGAFAAALDRTDGPTLLALSRQVVPNQSQIPVKTRREGVAKGAYIAVKEEGELKTILMGTGSELQHAIVAAKELGAGVRVVSVPCMERFNGQSAEYKESVLPKACTRRVAIEAGVPELWYRYVGLEGKIVAIPRFGLSAPGNIVMEKLGITAKSVVEAAQSLG
ncbi:MAG TPA: transketolase [Chthoniobacteraceae bacterium]|jgi:transketolase|nr:transketolase [Chthoniobacteraceae bacterium]